MLPVSGARRQPSGNALVVKPDKNRYDVTEEVIYSLELTNDLNSLHFGAIGVLEAAKPGWRK